MKMKMVALTLAVTTFFTGCVGVSFIGENFGGGSGGPAIRGTGEKISHEFDVSSFSGLRLGGIYNVTYRPHETHRVVIEIQENLLPHVAVYITGNILQIGSDRDFRVDPDFVPNVYVYSPHLSSLSVSGVVNFQTDDIVAADDFSINISGVGNVALSLDVGELDINTAGAGNLNIYGIADNTEIVISGAGSINAAELETRNADVRVSGAGSVNIAVSENLNASISGVGSITYHGNPNVTQSVSGIGGVRRAG